MPSPKLTYDLATEQQLLQEIAIGNELAFKQLFDAYRVRVFSFILNFTHSRPDSEEIVQDTFLTLWQNRVSLNNVEHPRNYIYTIVRNKTMRYLSDIARDEKMIKIVWANMQGEVNGTEEMLLLKESSGLIQQALSLLPEQKQRIFRMCRDEGMSHESIALETGLSKSRVKNIMVEVLKFIRMFLAQKNLALLIISSIYI